MIDEEGPITQAEMVEMFGETMPTVAAEILWHADEYATIGQVRAALRRISNLIKELKDEAR